MTFFRRSLDDDGDDDYSAVQPSDFAALVAGHRRFAGEIDLHALNSHTRRPYASVISRDEHATRRAVSLMLRLWEPPHWPN